MGEALLLALALVLILEGMLPFLSPRAWREVFEKAVRLNDGQIRFVGLLSLAGGLLLMILSQI